MPLEFPLHQGEFDRTFNHEVQSLLHKLRLPDCKIPFHAMYSYAEAAHNVLHLHLTQAVSNIVCYLFSYATLCSFIFSSNDNL